MKRDEALSVIVTLKHDIETELDDNCSNLAVVFDRKSGIVEAVNTIEAEMKKLEKIEQIVESKTTILSYDVGFEQIKKVVEE